MSRPWWMLAAQVVAEGVRAYDRARAGADRRGVAEVEGPPPALRPAGETDEERFLRVWRPRRRAP